MDECPYTGKPVEVVLAIRFIATFPWDSRMWQGMLIDSLLHGAPELRPAAPGGAYRVQFAFLDSERYPGEMPGIAELIQRENARAAGAPPPDVELLSE